MIISRDEAYAAIFDGRATATGTVIHDGHRYTVLDRHDEQRTDHVLDDPSPDGLDIFGEPDKSLYKCAFDIAAKGRLTKTPRP